MAEFLQSGAGIVVSGDGQCDYSGKCAKFCTYTLMEKSKNTIIHSETVDKKEVHNRSPNMEPKAVSRGLSHLKDKISIVEITTDCSTSVTKMLGISDSYTDLCMLYYSLLFQLTNTPLWYLSATRTS